MDYQDIRTLQLLEEIEQNHAPSQRYLADRLNVSLGLVNSFIKRLAKKGYFKVTTIPKNRVKYILTPKGVAEKTQLTYQYINYSYQFYKDARKRLSLIFMDLRNQGVTKILFFGISQFAEIAYISLDQTSIEITGVIETGSACGKFMGIEVSPPSMIKQMEFDRVLVTAEDCTEEILRILKAEKVPDRKIVKF